MAIQLLLVLFFQAEDDLDGTGTSGNLASVGYNDLRCVFEHVGCHVLSSNGVFGDTLLVAAHQI